MFLRAAIRAQKRTLMLCIIERKRFARKRSARYRTPPQSVNLDKNIKVLLCIKKNLAMPWSAQLNDNLERPLDGCRGRRTAARRPCDRLASSEGRVATAPGWPQPSRRPG